MHLNLNKVVIIGIGLIGSSFALALKRAGIVREVVGIDRQAGHVQRAHALAIIDTIAPNIDDALHDCDLVLLAAPVAQTSAILASIQPHLQAHTLITDVGSTKSDVIHAARSVLGAAIAQFIPGHPIAGREHHGPDAALANLYDGKKVILTPLPENSAQSIQLIDNIWQACGAQIEMLDAAQHDRVLASVSHLPHLLAYALVAQIEQADDAELKFNLAGSGFKDFTRIAASDPEMWRDIMLANRSAVLQELSSYQAMLNTVHALIEQGDGTQLESLFARASQARRSALNVI